jgi:hypothetical protein
MDDIESLLQELKFLFDERNAEEARIVVEILTAIREYEHAKAAFRHKFAKIVEKSSWYEARVSE